MLYNACNGRVDIEKTTIDYIKFGTGDRIMIMIPGVGDGFKTVKGMALPFAYMYRSFAKDFTVYVFSRRNNLPWGFTTRDMAADVKTAMDLMNIEKADVVGVSQGGMIAQYLAADYPDKVNRLVLAVTAHKTNKVMTEAVSSWIEMAKQDRYTDIMKDSAERSYTEKYLKIYRLMYPLLPMMKPKNLERFTIQAQSCLEHNAESVLDKINHNTLIIGAEKDKIVSGDASEKLGELIKNSTVYIYPDYSHGVYEEANDFNTKIHNFLLV